MKRKSSKPANYDITAMSGGTASRMSLERHRPGPAICRFFIKYRCFVVPIGLFMLVHLILAVCLTYLHCAEDIIDDHHGLRSTKSNATSHSSATLDLESLAFIPECNITSREAVSAIQRAKTQQCKEQLATTACKIATNTLYPTRLSRQCANNETVFGKRVGCFRDNKKHRILPDSFLIMKERNSPLNCIEMCLQSGFQYAGVQYGVECFCGNSEPSSKEIPVTECNMKCPDSSLSNYEYCGGYFAIDIFETGISQSQDGKSNVIGLEDYDPDLTMVSKPARIVFFLTLNGRSIRQVFRLIKALFHEKHYFYIHVDSRQDYLYRELLSLSHKLPNNFKFMTKRRGTIWGGASLLTILLEGMRDLVVNHKDWEWDYVINLSESDFPLKTTSKLEYFLSINNGKNFLKSHGRDVQKFIQKQGLDKTFDECEYRMWRVGDRKLPTGILMDGGSDWIALHRDFVKYTVESEDELVAGLKIVFKHTLLPAESFFHILLRNSEMCDTFVDNNLHVTNWRRKLGCKCQYRNIVDWCGCSPNDFRLADWSRLQLTDARLLFFGRKFEPIVNQGIINQLEGWLYPERFEKNYPTMDRFWLSLYHHHDLSPKPDDATVTLGQSLSRISAKRFLLRCFPSLSSEDPSLDRNIFSTFGIDLIEITAYNHEDQLEGILAKFHATTVDEHGEELAFGLEAWFRQETNVEAGAVNRRTLEFQNKLQGLKVGSDYEQKEQIFRNFAGALGPFSEPTLTYSVNTDETFNISVAWIDPHNVVRSVTNVSASDGSTANFIKPTLKHPLVPGTWTVKIFTVDRDLLYRVKFLVLPLEIYQGDIISLSDRRFVNSEEFDESDMRGTLTSSSHDLQLKIDDLTSRKYTLQDFCLEKRVDYKTLSSWKLKISDSTGDFKNQYESHEKEMQDSFENLETSLCSHTQWSSFYPDPKSTITGIDPHTGLLMP